MLSTATARGFCWNVGHRHASSSVSFTVVDGDGERTRVTAAEGTKLLTALQGADVALDAPCGGTMVCGACKVRLQAPGKTAAAQAAWLAPQSDRERATVARIKGAEKGTRLACGVVLAKDMQDMTVVLPPT